MKKKLLILLFIIPLSACMYIKPQYERGKKYVYENVKFKKPVKEVLVKRLPANNGPILQEIKELQYQRKLYEYENQKFINELNNQQSSFINSQEPLLWKDPIGN